MIKILFFLFIFGGLVARNFYLKDVHFSDWDESIYTQVAYEIQQNKTLITTFNGQLWLNKPPFSHALIATVFSIFGRSEFWARFLMVAIAMSLLILVYMLGKKIALNLLYTATKKLGVVEREFAYLLPVLALSSADIFIERSTLLNTDIMLGVSWVGYFLFRKTFSLKLAFLALGVYAKSFVGFYPLLFELLTIRRINLSLQNMKRAFLLVTFPLLWHIVSFLKFGKTFIEAHVMSNMVKRVLVPIELHFGGRMYYPRLFWENFMIVSLVIIAGYLVLAVDVLGLNRNSFKLKRLSKRLLSLIRSKKFWDYLILTSPLPFFLFLIFILKSKISWYFASVIPLFSLIIVYLYGRLGKKGFRYALIIVIIANFFWKFVPQTYALKVNYTVSDKLKVAECLSKRDTGTIAFLVNAQERQNRNVLEAAHLQTQTSFIYGGSPSFVFYVNQPLEYFYKPERFEKEAKNNKLLIISDSDKEQDKEIATLVENFDKISECSFGEWEVYRK